MYQNDDYNYNQNQNTSQNSTDFSNSNNQTMPETTTTNNVDNSSQKTAKTQTVAKKASLLIQAIQSKKGLYSRIKYAFIKQLSKNIDEGKSTASLDMDKFIVSLIEEGLRKG